MKDDLIEEKDAEVERQRLFAPWDSTEDDRMAAEADRMVAWAAGIILVCFAAAFIYACT